MKDATLPAELDSTLQPPSGLLDDLNQKPLCGGRFTALWTKGPMRGKISSAYCAEPFCIDTGYCTGAKFVAHTIQHNADGSVRPLSPLEVVPIARECARRATGKDDPRSDKEIWHFSTTVYARMSEAIKGGF